MMVRVLCQIVVRESGHQHGNTLLLVTYDVEGSAVALPEQKKETNP